MAGVGGGAVLPGHVAIIMDGNGRWARSKGLSRLRGHEEGVKAADRVARGAAEIGIKFLTLYAFSTENWKRPRREVSFLMRLLREFLVRRRKELAENDIRLVHVGSKEGLPGSVLRELRLAVEETRQCGRMTLGLALNYGGRDELVSAARALVERARGGERFDVDEAAFSNELHSAGFPDVDLLIRTGGEKRLSNFLLWKVSYAELYFAQVYWPAFTKRHLLRAVRVYGRRRRKFGGL